MLLYHYSLLDYLLDLDVGAGLKVADEDLVAWDLDRPVDVEVD